MDEEIERLVIGVRADTAGFAADVATLKASLVTGVGDGATQAGASLSSALLKATVSGKAGFDDLKSVALKAMDEIASAALKSAVGGSGGGLVSLATGLLGSALGLPGRATGGPVSQGSAYLVGERGPELFVPTSSGSIATMAAGQASRDIKVSIAVAAPAGSAPQALAQSGRQVARAVTQALRQAAG